MQGHRTKKEDIGTQIHVLLPQCIFAMMKSGSCVKGTKQETRGWFAATPVLTEHISYSAWKPLILWKAFLRASCTSLFLKL